MNKKILLSGFIFSAIILYADDNWKPVKKSGGVEVFNRDVQGSDIKEFKAAAVIDSSIDVVFEVMIDIPAAPLWMDNCQETKLVSVIDSFAISGNRIHAKIRVYHIISAPFPVSNRDFVIESEMNGDLKARTMSINFHAVTDNTVPPRSGYVRITELKGSWYFKYIDPNHTLAVYQVKQNPGGYLPAYLVNYVNSDIPYKTMTGLKRISKSGKYITQAEKNRLFTRKR